MLVYQRVNLMGRWWLTIGFWATKSPKAWDANNAILPVSSGRKQCFPNISFAQFIFCDPPKPTNFWPEFPISISTTLQALQSSTHHQPWVNTALLCLWWRNGHSGTPHRSLLQGLQPQELWTRRRLRLAGRPTSRSSLLRRGWCVHGIFSNA